MQSHALRFSDIPTINPTETSDVNNAIVLPAEASAQQSELYVNRKHTVNVLLYGDKQYRQLPSIP